MSFFDDSIDVTPDDAIHYNNFISGTARRITARLSEHAKSVEPHGNLKTMKYYPCHTRTGPALDATSG